MINWKSHRAALTGASKYLIKGVISVVHSVTSATVIVTPDCFLPLESSIGSEAQGLLGAIDATEIAESGIILEFNAFQGVIDSGITALQGAIDPDGEALNSNIQDSFGIQAALCDC